MPRIQIVISVQGGVVQDVFCSAEEAAELIMVDWDTEGCDRSASDVARVVEPDEHERFAFVSKCLTEPIWTMAGTDVEAAIRYAQSHSFNKFENELVTQPAESPIPHENPPAAQNGSIDAEDDSYCECEEPGFFYSGIPGIIARVENGRLAHDATVERCDLCQRYPSDEAARAKLPELGIA